MGVVAELQCGVGMIITERKRERGGGGGVSQGETDCWWRNGMNAPFQTYEAERETEKDRERDRERERSLTIFRF